MRRSLSFFDKHTNKYQVCLPYILVAPQLCITVIFFIFPVYKAVQQSFYKENPFGLSTHFVGLENYTNILSDPNYLYSIGNSFLIGGFTTIVSMVVALFLAIASDKALKNNKILQSIFIWPYAVAPAVSGLLWMFLLYPSIGILSKLLEKVGLPWNYFTSSYDARLLVIIAASWKQISYNFLFFLAGLQSIPNSLLEAASLDGANAYRRFVDIIFPLLAPTTFFLFVVNLVYAFCETFGVIDNITQGGPGNDTVTMVYNIYLEGFKGVSYGSSFAQSVLLMILITILIVFQFRFIERKIRY